jgi:hypothetical protein
MEIIKYLGDLLAEKLHIRPAAARGLVKLAINDKFSPFKPINQLKFNDYKEVIQNEVKNRLVMLGISDIDSVIDLLINSLIKNQSIITLSEV